MDELHEKWEAAVAELRAAFERLEQTRGTVEQNLAQLEADAALERLEDIVDQIGRVPVDALRTDDQDQPSPYHI